MDKNINKEQLGRMKQKAGATKHRAGPQSTPCSLRSVLVATWLRWIGKPSTCNRAAASRTKTPSSRQGLANSSFVLCVSGTAWKLGPSLLLGQVLKNKQKDNLRAKATDKDSRKLQAVRFKVREEMRPGRLSLSSSKPWLHTHIAWILHCSPQAPPLPAIMTSGRDFGLFGQLPVHLVYNFSFQAHIVRVEDNLLKQHLYIHIYIHTYILYTSEAPVMYRPKLHAQSRPKSHVIHQGAGVAEWRCTGYCSFTSSSGSNVPRPSERHR